MLEHSLLETAVGRILADLAKRPRAFDTTSAEGHGFDLQVCNSVPEPWASQGALPLWGRDVQFTGLVERKAQDMGVEWFWQMYQDVNHNTFTRMNGQSPGYCVGAYLVMPEKPRQFTMYELLGKPITELGKAVFNNENTIMENEANLFVLVVDGLLYLFHEKYSTPANFTLLAKSGLNVAYERH